MKSIFEENLKRIRQIQIKKIKKPFRPTRTKEDIKKLLVINQNLNTTPENKSLNAVLILTAFYGGLRVKELAELKLEDLY